MKKIDKVAIKKLADNSIILVKFTKLDGSEREMRCTLQTHLLPQKQIGHMDEIKPDPRFGSPDILAVFDLDKKEWRSFRIDRVLDVKQFDENNV